MRDDFLKKVTARKQKDLEAAMQTRPVKLLRQAAEERAERTSFIRALEPTPTGDIHIIAEIKRASPSKGDIATCLDPAKLAGAYEKGGARAISVLTEPHWFKGSIGDLQAAKAATRLPVLRKDFIVSDYQVYESAAIGADAVLLIAAILSPAELARLLDICRSVAIDALVEVHSPSELETVKSSGARLIGINNRNLRTLKTDIQIAMDMAGHLNPDQIPVAASGIRTRANIEKNRTAGIYNFLIGEHLVRAADPENFLKTLGGNG